MKWPDRSVANPDASVVAAVAQTATTASALATRTRVRPILGMIPAPLPDRGIRTAQLGGGGPFTVGNEIGPIREST